MINQKFTESDVAFDFPFKSQLHRLIMVYINISGSLDGGKEKLIFDRKFLNFCCCTSAEFIDAMDYLVENGFLKKFNYGMQFGEAASGYMITVPDKLREGS